MRIYIKEKSGHTIWIPIPICIVQFACSIAGSQFVRQYIPNDAKQYIDCVNFHKISRSFGILRHYRGVQLVHVKSTNGDEVTITI